MPDSLNRDEKLGFEMSKDGDYEGLHSCLELSHAGRLVQCLLKWLSLVLEATFKVVNVLFDSECVKLNKSPN